jgi:RNA polymerase sigma factor (sigma-70 family)
MGGDGTNEMNESYLIQLAQQGNQNAFTEIYNRYRQPLYYFILRRVHNETDAEDLVMESFERAFASIKYFIPFVKLSTWLHEIAKNRIVDFIRAKKITPQMVEPDYNVRDNLTPERICIYNQEYGMVQEGIRTLRNDTHRKVMTMYCQGWKMKEIALELKIPIGSVVNYIHRSKHKLKKLVA